jgi:hypothetical protein
VLGHAFEPAGLVDDALEQAPDGRSIERPRVEPLDVLENLVLAFRLVDGQAQGLFGLSDRERAGSSFVQEAHELLVELIDPTAKRVNVP